MKKIVALLLCAVTLIGLCSCGSNEEKTVDTVMKMKNNYLNTGDFAEQEDFKKQADEFEALLSTVLDLQQCSVEEDINLFLTEIVRTYTFPNNRSENLSCTIKLGKKYSIDSSWKSNESYAVHKWEYSGDINGYESKDGLMARCYINPDGETVSIYFLPHQNGVQSSRLTVAGFTFLLDPSDLSGKFGSKVEINNNITRTTSFEEVIEMYGTPDEMKFEATTLGIDDFSAHYKDNDGNSLIFKFSYYYGALKEISFYNSGYGTI